MRTKAKKYADLIKRYLKGKKLNVIFLFFVMLINTELQLFAPQVVRDVIDGIVGEATRKQILTWLIIFFSVMILGEILKIIIAYVSSHIAWYATNGLRKDLLRRCLEQTEESIHNFKQGEILEIMDGDVQILVNFFSTLFVVVIQAMLLVMGTLLFIYFENSWIGIIETIFVCAVFILFGKIHNIAVPKWKKDREYAGHFYGYLGECIEAKEDIKANGEILYVMENLKKILEEWFPNHMKAGIFGMTSYAMYIFIVAMSYAIIFGGGAYFWKQGTITIGTIYLLYQYNQNLILPIQRLRNQIDDLQRVTASIERIQMLFEQPVEDKKGILLECDGGICVSVERLSFSYQKERKALKEISFSIEKNERLTIIGRTGSGKTTLVKLLTKMYPVTQGNILLNGVSISEIALKSVRSKIAYITQEVQIFEASLRDNITIFDKSVKDEQLVHFIYKLGLKDWFENLKDGLDTRINVHILSEGQAQMIAMIRVFLKDAKLIILDEAYSNIDPLTESYIQKAMKNLCEKRTVVVIAHRLKTLEQTDRVLLMEDGNVGEYGKYSELKENPSSKLWQLLHQNVREVLE